MKLLAALAIFFGTFALIGCAKSALPEVEPVLTEGMKISAITPSGKIVVEGGKGFARTYSGEGWSKSSNLIPRRTRWYGSLGLYDPAGSFSMHDRLIIDEGRQFFETESEALRYLKSMSGYFGQLTYTSNGLVVAYKVIEIPGGRPTRNLTIWQIYINGAKPTSLRGAVDKNIQISGGITPEKALPIPAPTGYERKLSSEEYTPAN